jgi:hypothetical protein
VLSDAEFAQLTETATCKQCYAGYKLRSTNRDETEKGLCLACRFTLRTGRHIENPEMHPPAITNNRT